MVIKVGFVDGFPVGTFQVLDSKAQTNNLKCDMTSLGNSYNEWDKVENPTFIPVSYEGSDNEGGEHLENDKNINTNYDVVNDDHNSKENKETFLAKKTRKNLK